MLERANIKSCVAESACSRERSRSTLSCSACSTAWSIVRGGCCATARRGAATARAARVRSARSDISLAAQGDEAEQPVAGPGHQRARNGAPQGKLGGRGQAEAEEQRSPQVEDVDRAEELGGGARGWRAEFLGQRGQRARGGRASL